MDRLNLENKQVQRKLNKAWMLKVCLHLVLVLLIGGLAMNLC
jgi:hypothetical protein